MLAGNTGMRRTAAAVGFSIVDDMAAQTARAELRLTASGPPRDALGPVRSPASDPGGWARTGGSCAHRVNGPISQWWSGPSSRSPARSAGCRVIWPIDATRAGLRGHLVGLSTRCAGDGQPDSGWSRPLDWRTGSHQSFDQLVEAGPGPRG